MDREPAIELSVGPTGSPTGVPHPGPAQFRLVGPTEGFSTLGVQSGQVLFLLFPNVRLRYLAAIESQDRATHPFFNHDLQLFILFINDFLASTGGVAAGLPT